MPARRAIPPVALAALALAAPGCRQADGTVLYPVLGVGLIAMRDDTTAPGTRAHELTALGVIAAPAGPIAGATVGVLRSRTLAVAPDANVLIDARADAAGWRIRITPITQESRP